MRQFHPSLWISNRFIDFKLVFYVTFLLKLDTCIAQLRSRQPIRSEFDVKETAQRGNGPQSRGSQGSSAVNDFEDGNIFGGRPNTPAPLNVPDYCETKRLFCPPGCEIKLANNGCPHNCNCGTKPRCPRVNCPLPRPRCLILTNLDGCQTCGCRDPVVILTDDNGSEKVVFLRLTALDQSPLTPEQIRHEEARAKEEPVSSFRPFQATQERVLANAISKAEKNGNGTIVDVKGKKYYLQTKPVFEEDEIPVSSRAHANPCTDADKRKLDNAFRTVTEFLARSSNAATGHTFAFPTTYKHSKENIKQVCVSYRNALRDVGTSLVHKCKPQYKPVGDVVAAMDYPCSAVTQYGFNRYYECIRGTSRNATMIRCQQSARSQIGDPFVDQCDVFNIMAECIYDPIVYLCGYAAWEVEYQYLAINVRQTVPTCRLQRISRKIDFTFAK